MNIEINLIQDWQSLILQKVVELKNDGFLCDLDYDDWITNRRDRLEEEKKRLVSKRKSLIGEDVICIDTIIASKEKDIARTGLENEHKESLILDYYTLKYVRLICELPRQIKFPNGFYCSPKYQKGLDFLLNKVRKGESLLPHLSRQIFDSSDNSLRKKNKNILDPSKDGLLFDWGIHHFHLGLKFDEKRTRLIKGTEDVLYAIVSDNYFYILVIKDHSHWVDRDLLRIVRDNFSEIIEPDRHTQRFWLPFKVNESDHKQLRNIGTNTLLDLDGVYYNPPGSGFISGGGSKKAQYIRLDDHHRYLKAQEIIDKELQQEIRNKELQKALAVTAIQYNTSLDCIQPKMSELETDRITVKCPKYGTKAVLFYNKQKKFTSISLQLSHDEGGIFKILS